MAYSLIVNRRTVTPIAMYKDTVPSPMTPIAMYKDTVPLPMTQSNVQGPSSFTNMTSNYCIVHGHSSPITLIIIIIIAIYKATVPSPL